MTLLPRKKESDTLIFHEEKSKFNAGTNWTGKVICTQQQSELDFCFLLKRLD